MASALELRPGNVIRHGGRACIVTSWNIVRSDRRQWIRMKVRDIETGNQSDIKESSETKFEVLDKDEKDLAYSYRDGPVEVFFTTEGEEVRCAVHAAKDALLWPADSYVGFYVDGQLISISPPKMCVIEVVETAPPIKNAGTGQKEAVLSNGVKIKVGKIIDVGDRVRIDTEAMEFRERVT